MFGNIEEKLVFYYLFSSFSSSSSVLFMLGSNNNNGNGKYSFFVDKMSLLVCSIDFFGSKDDLYVEIMIIKYLFLVSVNHVKPHCFKVPFDKQ